MRGTVSARLLKPYTITEIYHIFVREGRFEMPFALERNAIVFEGAGRYENLLIVKRRKIKIVAVHKIADGESAAAIADYWGTGARLMRKRNGILLRALRAEARRVLNG